MWKQRFRAFGSEATLFRNLCPHSPAQLFLLLGQPSPNSPSWTTTSSFMLSPCWHALSGLLKEMSGVKALSWLQSLHFGRVGGKGHCSACDMQDSWGTWPLSTQQRNQYLEFNNIHLKYTNWAALPSRTGKTTWFWLLWISKVWIQFY